MIVAQREQKSWIENEDGVAAVEFTMVFPLMFLMMLAIWDLGHGIVANQKAIAASQMVADLVAREITIDSSKLDDVYNAGEIAMMPAPIDDNLVIEVLSVGFDEVDGTICVRFHDTSNDSTPDPHLQNYLEPLSVPGDGAVAVQVTYTYRPFFGAIVMDDITIKERAFARGRKTAIVNLSGASPACGVS